MSAGAPRLRTSSRPLAIGDSIMEGADLPVICGRRPINAGIGWATVATFATHGKRLAELAQPKFVVVALGTNDALAGHDQGFNKRLTSLVASLAAWPVVLVPLPNGLRITGTQIFNAAIAAMPVAQAPTLKAIETMPDGIHLTARDYVDWNRAIVGAASGFCMR